MLTYVFPGQGSQHLGMGKEVFDLYPDLVARANSVLGYSIVELCLEDSDNKLDNTAFTQPAIFVVSALSYLKKIKDTGQKPHFLAGHSLGEYNALFAADVFDFETGLRLVQKRGELMSQARDGGMAAVIGLTRDQIHSVLQQYKLETISVANYNSYTQFVLSGGKAEIESAGPIFTEAGAAYYIPLKVSGAFHSPLMDDAQKKFATYLLHFKYSYPRIPVLANVNAQPYNAVDVSYNLASQISRPVLWINIVEYLKSCGVQSFEEIGPGQTLTGLIRRISNGQ